MNSESSKIRNFTDLIVWQKAQSLVLEIYKLTEAFPRDERYSLTDQIRRAAISATSNIAEGFSRNSYKEKIHFYGIAQGSTAELQNQLILGKDLGYIPISNFDETFQRSILVHKLINGLIKGARKISNT